MLFEQKESKLSVSLSSSTGKFQETYHSVEIHVRHHYCKTIKDCTGELWCIKSFRYRSTTTTTEKLNWTEIKPCFARNYTFKYLLNLGTQFLDSRWSYRHHIMWLIMQFCYDPMCFITTAKRFTYIYEFQFLIQYILISVVHKLKRTSFHGFMKMQECCNHSNRFHMLDLQWISLSCIHASR